MARLPVTILNPFADARIGKAFGDRVFAMLTDMEMRPQIAALDFPGFASGLGMRSVPC